MSDHQGDRLVEGHDKTYPAAFSTGETRGLQDAGNEEKIAGRNEGFAAAIDRARMDAKARGQADEDQRFQNSGVLRLASAGIRLDPSVSQQAGLGAGDLLLVDANIANLGAKDTLDGESTVTLQSLSPHLVVTQKPLGTPAIAADTMATIHSLFQVKISEGTRAGEKLQLKVVLTHQDGRVDTSLINVVTVERFGATLAVTSAPKKFKVGQDAAVKFSVSNTGKIKPIDPIRVVLTAVGASGLVKFAHSPLEQDYRELPVGKTDTSGTLAFQVTKAAHGKRITMRLTVFHGLSELSHVDFTIAP